MSELKFQFFSDVNTRYGTIEIFSNSGEHFMDIRITDDKDLNFTIYPQQENVILTTTDWERILNEAKDFLPRAIQNEETFERFNAENGW